MQRGGYQEHPLMKLTIGLSLMFLFGFWITNFLLYFSKMSLNPSSIISYYLGSEMDFQPARTYLSMLEVLHFHLPMMALIILLLTHLVIFAPLSHRGKIILIVVSFMSALSNETAGWLVRFIHPFFAWLKIVSFITLQSSYFVLMTILTVFLAKSKRKSDKKDFDLVQFEEFSDNKDKKTVLNKEYYND